MTIGTMKLFMASVLIDEQKYIGKQDRDDILKEWKKITDGREFKFFIHYLPKIDLRGKNPVQCQLYVPKIPKIRKDKDVTERPEPCNQIQHNMCRKLSDEQEKILKENLFEGTVKELADKAKVDPKVVYKRRANYTKIAVIPDKKKIIVRPPSVYSNPRPYDQI